MNELVDFVARKMAEASGTTDPRRFRDDAVNVVSEVTAEVAAEIASETVAEAAAEMVGEASGSPAESTSGAKK